MKRTIDIQEAQRDLPDLVVEASSGMEIILTRNGRPVAHLVSPSPRSQSAEATPCGIRVGDGPTGRRAVVEGTGLDVWEIVATWKAEDRSEEALRRSYPWLTPEQLHAALDYYEHHPEEIDGRLERERRWTPERVARELPFARLDPSSGQP